MEECLEIESSPEMVLLARRFVRRTLAAWELTDLIDDAVLAASELVSNAVLHARTSLRLSLRSDGLSGVRIEVFDENTRMPVPASCPEDATSGRGLHLVAAIGSGWGTEQREDGKVVWVQLGPVAAPPEEACLDLAAVDGVPDALDRLGEMDGDSAPAG